jgi:predicted HD phosphohydrolase
MVVRDAVVTFAALHESTAADFAALREAQRDQLDALPERLLNMLKAPSSIRGFQVSSLGHALQSASRAYRDSRPDVYVAGCLLHDIADELAPKAHGAAGAAIIGPYLGPRMSWIVEQHDIFQLKYYGQHVGEDPDLREKYRGQTYFDDTVEFCECYDENCFDPHYKSMKLQEFAPLVSDLFTRKVERVIPSS